METRSLSSESEIPAWLFGLPISRISPESALERILDWAGERGRCRFIATSNVDFLVKALTWWPSPPRHPELVEVLRGAELNTADGMPLVWAAEWLGAPLPGRVAGSDLVPALSRLAARRGIPLFLLGGQEAVTRRAAERLVEQNPGLEIAGIDTPFVVTEGGDMAFEEEKDRAICERINRSGAGILLIGFGNPKQEMWFQRNAHRLEAGVALGVGGTFNFIAGEVARAPEWMQKSGLEWVFRFAAEPGRLWKRYALGLAKFTFISAPVCLAHLVHSFRRKNRTGGLRVSAHFYSGAHALRVVRLPEVLDSRSGGDLTAAVDCDAETCIVLDAGGCVFIDAAGLGALWVAVNRAVGGCYFLNPSRPLRHLLRLHRGADFLSPITCPSPGILSARLRERFADSRCFISIETLPDLRRISFLGGLTVEELSGIDRSQLVRGLADLPLCVDLGYCTRLDGEGLALILRLLHFAREAGHAARVERLSDEVERSSRVAGLRLDPKNEG